MPREYTPLPFEYYEEMQDLTNEEFGELVRALILYARDGKEISCEGKGNIFRVRLMRKDDHYAKANEEEEKRKKKRSDHAKTAINARWNIPENTDEETSIPENVIPNQSNPNQDQTNPNQDQSNPIVLKSLRSSCSELNLSSEPEEAPVVKIPLNDKSEYPIYQRDIEKWQAVYQAVDVMDQVQRMPLWFEANPAKKKTAKGILRFINSWLAKEQDHGGAAQAAGGRKQGAGEKKAPTLTEFD